MAIKITDECINCGACEPECPNTAIYEGGAEWKFSEGTSLKGNYTGKNSNKTVDADDLIGFSQKIEEFYHLYKNKDCYETLSQSCREHIVNNYSIESMYKKYLNLWDYH